MSANTAYIWRWLSQLQTIIWVNFADQMCRQRGYCVWWSFGAYWQSNNHNRRKFSNQICQKQRVLSDDYSKIMQLAKYFYYLMFFLHYCLLVFIIWWICNISIILSLVHLISFSQTKMKAQEILQEKVMQQANWENKWM